jgi:hypothetical protein
VDHMLLTCHRARKVWSFFASNNYNMTPSNYPDLLLHRHHTSENATINTAIAWNIWKRRNALVFNGIDEPLPITAARCLEDVRLWAFRFQTAGAQAQKKVGGGSLSQCTTTNRLVNSTRSKYYYRRIKMGMRERILCCTDRDTMTSRRQIRRD